MVGLIVTGLAGSMGTVLVAVLGYFVFRHFRAAQTDDMNASAGERRANAHKTDAEAWGLMSGNYTNLLQQLGEVQTKLDEMQTAHRAALRHIVDVHDWESRGRPGPLPSPPDDLAIPA